MFILGDIFHQNDAYGAKDVNDYLTNDSAAQQARDLLAGFDADVELAWGNHDYGVPEIPAAFTHELFRTRFHTEPYHAVDFTHCPARSRMMSGMARSATSSIWFGRTRTRFAACTWGTCTAGWTRQTCRSYDETWDEHGDPVIDMTRDPAFDPAIGGADLDNRVDPENPPTP